MAQDAQSQPVALKDAVGFALEEARMVLPGIQALFGFQLIAVFSQRFDEVFDGWHQGLHLAALALVALACGLAMTPAAYHRQVERGRVSQRLLDRASAFIGWALLPLMLAISIDLGLVGYAITGSDGVALALGLCSAAVLSACWLVFPRVAKRRQG
ncbi:MULTISPECIES: DUF6328 family protein [Ramlibacter]|uniref:Sodium:proton antiporter n=1 Tax=Ramlibacter aquaticus TaxID=2780094 RepID=A0ABR9SJR2_9BURK|nr:MULTISPECIES: DUF6328 family protein [Ramlibacter]MBE7942515.1 hypothetical protein [Ramlibacter aquaticus]